jgi:hypothetical protein
MENQPLVMPEYATHRIGKEHFYAYLRRPPSSFPTHELEDGTLVPYGWSESTIEIGPTNSLYLHVDLNASGEPIGVEVLDADEKLASGWRDSVSVNLDRQEVTVSDVGRIVTDMTAVYGTVRAQLGYDGGRKLIRMRFEVVFPDDPDYEPDRWEDPALEAFLASPPQRL